MRIVHKSEKFYYNNKVSLAKFIKELPLEILAIYQAYILTGLNYLTLKRQIAMDTMNIVKAADESVGIAKYCNWIFILLIFLAVARGAMGNFRNRRVLFIAGVTLLYMAICFFIPLYWDNSAEITRAMFYPPIAIIMIGFKGNLSERRTAFHFVMASSSVAVFSLIMVAISPSSAIRQDYDSFIPGLSGRLYGATPHANYLGAACILPILLVFCYHLRLSAPILIALAANIICLVWAQSKTSDICTIVGIAILLFTRFKISRVFTNVYVAMSLFFMFLIFEYFYIKHVIEISYPLYLAGTSLQRQYASATLTGRSFIWIAALKLYSGTPVLGPGWYNFVSYMHTFHPEMMDHPHNIFIASLLRCGYPGIIAVTLMLSTWLWASCMEARDRHYFPIIYFVSICLHGTSESFLLEDAFGSSIFLSTFIYLRMLTNRMPLREERQRRDVKMRLPQFLLLPQKG
jgi:O-antigen ligase